MSNKEDFVRKILEDIYALDEPKLEESRKSQISNMVSVAINGGEVQTYIVKEVIAKNDESSVYVYMLTNSHFIIVTIDIKEEIKTYKFTMPEIRKISFQSPKQDSILVNISLFNGKILGFEYFIDETKTTNFFQKLEQALIK